MKEIHVPGHADSLCLFNASRNLLVLSCLSLSFLGCAPTGIIARFENCGHMFSPVSGEGSPVNHDQPLTLWQTTRCKKFAPELLAIPVIGRIRGTLNALI